MKNRVMGSIIILSLCLAGLFTAAPIAQAKEPKNNKEYWCKKASVLQRAIDKARDNVRYEEEKLKRAKNSRPSMSYKQQKSYEARISELERKVERAKNSLNYAEKDLQDLENEAHRKSIPPGWLRCQFTY
jgi:septal ring factor EnvC (AmiA/AmiB activator)